MQTIQTTQTTGTALATQTIQAFVSYSSQNTSLVTDTIVPALKDCDVTPWIYQATIPGGNWIEAVFEKIRDGDWFVVVLTDPYAASVRAKQGACYHELLWMLDQATTSRRRSRLVILWVSGDLPDLLRTWQAIDLRRDMGRLVPDVKRAAEADRAEGPERPRQPPSRPIAGELPPLPEVRGPGDLPDLAKYNFGVIAHRYARSMVAGKPMQRDNGETLLRLVSRLIDQGKVRRPEAWLDAGCGTGLMASLCDQLQTAPEFRWLRYAKTRVGFDYSPQMLSITNNQQPDPNEGYTHLVDGDCRWFGRDNLFREAGVQQVDLILMNNVLHWLFTSDAIERALHQSYEMLDRFGGCVAASIAAVGTGSVFYGAYKAELEERLEADQKERWRAHIENPIGLQSLDTIVDIARKCRFRIERAQLTYEPKEYDSTDEYVRDVRAYGEAVLMAPLLHLSPQERERVWSSVSDRFRELHRAKFNQAAYVHNQFMIYLVAVRND